MKLYEAIADAIDAEMCPALFGVMGDGNMLIWSALARNGNTRIVAARHEDAAVGMADGYARTTNGLGIATVTHGPGLSQVGTALVTAVRNRTPLMLIVGEFPESGNRIQWMDQRGFARVCGAPYLPVTQLDMAAREIREAFYTARTQRCPVVLGVPTALQEENVPEPWRYRPSTDFLPASSGAIDPGTVERLVTMLSRAERPVVVAGRGAKLAGAQNEVIELADRLGALLGTTLLAKELFSGHDYDIGIVGGYASAPAQALLRDADVILGVGAELGFFTTQGGSLFPRADIARIDTRPPHELGFAPGLHVQGDARSVMAEVNRILADRDIRRTGFRTKQTRDLLKITAPHVQPGADGRLDPRLLMRHLSAGLPDNLLVTFGAGHFLGLAAMFLALPEGAHINLPIQFGAIGQTLPCAIGGAIADPARPHVVIEGDGSLLMTLQELETVTRIGLSMVLIVWNDAGYGAEVHKLRARGLDGSIAQWSSPDFVSVARALGGDGVRLGMEEEIAGAVAEGFRRGGLFVIDAPVSPDIVSDVYKKFYGLKNDAPPLRRPG